MRTTNSAPPSTPRTRRRPQARPTAAPSWRTRTTSRRASRKILAYLAEGHSGAYISDVLFISPNTVRTHIHNIYRKLDVSSREDILRLTKG